MFKAHFLQVKSNLKWNLAKTPSFFENNIKRMKAIYVMNPIFVKSR